MAAYLIEPARRISSVRQPAKAVSVRVSCVWYLIRGVTSRHLCHVLLVRSKPEVPAHSKGGDHTDGKAGHPWVCPHLLAYVCPPLAAHTQRSRATEVRSRTPLQTPVDGLPGRFCRAWSDRRALDTRITLVAKHPQNLEASPPPSLFPVSTTSCRLS